eukprot:scaffold4121_cov128-Skeletonema_dohrnii-CCMP3373.AAC.6
MLRCVNLQKHQTQNQCSQQLIPRTSFRLDVGVGSAYMNAFKSKGHNVVGIEASPTIIENLRKSSGFEMNSISDDLSGLVGIDLIMISVCTPLRAENGRLDMTYIYSTLGNVAVLVRNNPKSTVVIRSTVVSALLMMQSASFCHSASQHTQADHCTTLHLYTFRLLEPSSNTSRRLRRSWIMGSRPMAFQPEFLRARSAMDDAMYPWYVVIGICGEHHPRGLYDLYLDFVDSKKIKIMPAEEAELLKIFHNSFNAAKISFFNQCDLLCKQMNEKNATLINANNITETLAHTCEGLMNAKYGTKAGHGYYGSCLPKDSSELQGLESEYGLASTMFAEVVRVNKEVVQNDKAENRKEVLDGDFHMSCLDMLPPKKKRKQVPRLSVEDGDLLEDLLGL